MRDPDRPRPTALPNYHNYHAGAAGAGPGACGRKKTLLGKCPAGLRRASLAAGPIGGGLVVREGFRVSGDKGGDLAGEG
jgi:hypothetical protein